jgi:ATP-dependent helicase YprA (DUF1998 family)
MGWKERLLNKNYISSNKRNVLDLKETILLASEKVFGYDQLREGQLEAAEAYLSGKDTLVSIKTGGGKTFCYVVCALLFEGITIVISPLKALMEDQKVNITLTIEFLKLFLILYFKLIARVNKYWYSLCFTLCKYSTRQK